MDKKMKWAVAAIVMATVAMAVDVELKSAPFARNENNLAAFDQYLQEEKHFRAASKKDLEKNLREDWILAEHYIKNGLSDYEKAMIVNMVNGYLARKETEKMQREAGIDEKVVKSYYLDHLAEYKLKPILQLKIFRFDTLDNAFDFFQYAREHTYTEAEDFASKMGVAKKPFNYPSNMAPREYRNALRDMTQTGYFTAPQLIRDEYTILYVEKITHREGSVPFGEIKETLSQELWKKTYLKKRAELVSSYQDK